MEQPEKTRAIADVFRIMSSDMYINEKGYWTKTVELLLEIGYYRDNESIFKKGKAGIWI